MRLVEPGFSNPIMHAHESLRCLSRHWHWEFSGSTLTAHISAALKDFKWRIYLLTSTYVTDASLLVNTSDKPLSLSMKKMEEQGNQASQQLGNTPNTDSPVQASGSTRTLNTGEASNSVDIASLAKEILGLNERLLLLMEKSLIQKEPVATDSGFALLEPTPEEHEAASKSAWDFFTAMQPNDAKAETTLSLFLAAFCTEAVGCYNRSSAQSMILQDMRSLAKPAIVLRGTSINAPASEWGPFPTFEDEPQQFHMHREGKDSELDPGDLDKISAAWPKSLQRSITFWTGQSLTILIVNGDSGRPVSLVVSREVGQLNNGSYFIFSAADPDLNELRERRADAKI